jgi:hypothetical protein
LASRGEAKKRKPLFDIALKHLQRACIEANDGYSIEKLSDWKLKLKKG